MGTNDTSDASRHTGEPSVIGDHGGTGDSEPDTRPISVVSPRAVSRHRPAPGRWTPSARGGYASHARTEPIPPVSQLSGSIEVEFTASQGVLSVPDDEAVMLAMQARAALGKQVHVRDAEFRRATL